jgi:hypothetical protein
LPALDNMAGLFDISTSLCRLNALCWLWGAPELAMNLAFRHPGGRQEEAAAVRRARRSGARTIKKARPRCWTGASRGRRPARASWRRRRLAQPSSSRTTAATWTAFSGASASPRRSSRIRSRASASAPSAASSRKPREPLSTTISGSGSATSSSPATSACGAIWRSARPPWEARWTI